VDVKEVVRQLVAMAVHMDMDVGMGISVVAVEVKVAQPCLRWPQILIVMILNCKYLH
jgi:hypothetical protein